ncbi:unnamed protein product [Symbiodinium sp. CCMP2592]|nr:unnamed protein product [Symbiodinium sp. CCMP2592]
MVPADGPQLVSLPPVGRHTDALEKTFPARNIPSREDKPNDARVRKNSLNNTPETKKPKLDVPVKSEDADMQVPTANGDVTPGASIEDSFESPRDVEIPCSPSFNPARDIPHFDISDEEGHDTQRDADDEAAEDELNRIEDLIRSAVVSSNRFNQAQAFHAGPFLSLQTSHLLADRQHQDILAFGAEVQMQEKRLKDLEHKITEHDVEAKIRALERKILELQETGGGEGDRSPVRTGLGTRHRSPSPRSPRFQNHRNGDASPQNFDGEDLDIVVGGWNDARKSDAIDETKNIFKAVQCEHVIADVFVPFSRTTFAKVKLTFPQPEAHISIRRQFQFNILDKLRAKKFQSGVPGSVGDKIWATKSKTPEERAKTRAIVLTKTFYQQLSPGLGKPCFNESDIEISWNGKVYIDNFQLLGSVYRDGEPEADDVCIEDAKGNHMNWYIKAKVFHQVTGRPVEDLQELWLSQGPTSAHVRGKGFEDIRTAWPTLNMEGFDVIGLQELGNQFWWLMYEPNWKAFATLTVILLGVVYSFSLSLRKLTSQLRMIGELTEEVAGLRAGLAQAQAPPQGSFLPLPAGPTVDLEPLMASLNKSVASMENTLHELQAEIKVTTYKQDLQDLLQHVEAAKASLEQLADPVTKSCDRITELHESYKKNHLSEMMKMLASKVESTDIDELKKLVQGELLKMMQQFAAAETIQIKAVQDKAIALETGIDRSLNLHKTLSNELHVCKTVLESKIDKIAKDLKDHQGWCMSSFRPLFPLVPTLKYIGDSTKDAMGYHVSHNQQLQHLEQMNAHLEQLNTELRTTVNSLWDMVESLEARMGRVESTSMGALDAINEQSEQVQVIHKETPQMLQQVLERLPKLPLRKPPVETPTPAPAQSSADPPGPSQHHQPPVTTHTPPAQTIELRLAGEHMPVPLPNRQHTGPIYMVQPPQQMPQASQGPTVVQLTQEELLKAFFRPPP